MLLAEKAEAAIRMVREANVLVFDTETSGVDWTRNWPVGYVISPNPKTSLYIPIRHKGGGNLPGVPPLESADQPSIQLHQFERDLAAAIASRRPHQAIVGHNVKFDAHFAANAEIYLGRNLEDTQINQCLLDEFSKSFSLDGCAAYWDVTAKKGDPLYQAIANQVGCEAKRSAMAHFWETNGSDPVVVDYTEGDGITTWEVFNKQMPRIEEEGLNVVHRLESQLIWTVYKMERNGIRVDMERLEEVEALLDQKAQEARLRLPEGLNPRSGKQMREWMESCGHTDWPTTAKGNPSFTEQWLKTHEEGRAVLDLRRSTNMVNSFLRPLKENHVRNGRVHCSFNQMKADDYGTISGRFSSSHPNMQQVPKRNKELGALFRSVFIPEDGMEFFEVDYSQCEPRLFAHYAQEPSLLEGYNSEPPRDMHQVVADLFKVERDPTAKRMNMGILTGMYPKTFAGHMDWPLDKAKHEWDRWFSFFPGITNFQQLAKSAFKRRGYVKTILGRKCRLDNPQFAYKAVSRIIQGSNADIVKERLLAADLLMEEAGSATKLQLTVHDSYGGSTPADRVELDKLVKVFEDVLSDPYNLRVPFRMDVGMGANWAEATYGG